MRLMGVFCCGTALSLSFVPVFHEHPTRQAAITDGPILVEIRSEINGMLTKIPGNHRAASI